MLSPPSAGETAPDVEKNVLRRRTVRAIEVVVKVMGRECALVRFRKRRAIRDLSRPRVRPPALAVGIGVLWVTLAGCASMGTSGATDRQAVIDRIVAASAKVTVEQGGRRITSGSGVVVASKAAGSGVEAVSYVLTAAHILENKDGAKVFVRFTGAYAVRGKFAATVPRRGSPETLDLALLQVSGVSVPPISFPAEDRVRVGEEILVVGFPWGKRLGLFSGIVSQVPGDGKEDVPADDEAEQSIVVDASSSRGVSGGGVFREETGSLVGVVEGYQTASIAVKDRAQTYSVKVPMPGETFVVPIGRIRRFLGEAGIGEASGMSGKIENPGE